MFLVERFRRKSAHWTPSPKASHEVIAAFIEQVGCAVPKAYLAFLKVSNGGQGWHFGYGWVHLWSTLEIFECNRELSTREFIPNFIAIGNNGAGEIIVFDQRDGEDSNLFQIPYIPMKESEAQLIAESFEDFLVGLAENYTC